MSSWDEQWKSVGAEWNSSCGPSVEKKAIIKNDAGIGRPLALATKDRLVANGKAADLDAYDRIGGQELMVADDFDAVADNEEVYQILLGCRKADYADVMKDVKEAQITAWWDRAVDIIPASGGKGTAITRILAHYHLSKEEAMAFGDGNNDIEMLKAVGMGVAMQNASMELKVVADAICDDVAHDGIYLYCKEHGLI